MRRPANGEPADICVPEGGSARFRGSKEPTLESASTKPGVQRYVADDDVADEVVAVLAPRDCERRRRVLVETQPRVERGASPRRPLGSVGIGTPAAPHVPSRSADDDVIDEVSYEQLKPCSDIARRHSALWARSDWPVELQDSLIPEPTRDGPRTCGHPAPFPCQLPADSHRRHRPRRTGRRRDRPAHPHALPDPVSALRQRRQRNRSPTQRVTNTSSVNRTMCCTTCYGCNTSSTVDADPGCRARRGTAPRWR